MSNFISVKMIVRWPTAKTRKPLAKRWLICEMGGMIFSPAKNFANFFVKWGRYSYILAKIPWRRLNSYKREDLTKTPLLNTNRSATSSCSMQVQLRQKRPLQMQVQLPYSDVRQVLRNVISSLCKNCRNLLSQSLKKIREIVWFSTRLELLFM